jgi:hypothetical protein
MLLYIAYTGIRFSKSYHTFFYSHFVCLVAYITGFMMMPILFFFVLLRIIIYYRLFLLNEVDRNVYTLGSGTSIEVGQNPQVVE